MDEQSCLVNLHDLLLRLALETQELAQTKDDLTQQIQTYKADIEEQKKCIVETQKTIKNMEENIEKKQATVKCYKENVKSLRGTSELLLQYEKLLETELERRQESYNKDMKMFQERIENYWKIFQQHKDEYLQNPLATKLLKIQADNEEIEKRIRIKEGEILVKESELKALQEVSDWCESIQKHVGSYEQTPSCESGNPSEAYITSQDPQSQVQFETKATKTEDIHIEMNAKAWDDNQKLADGVDESNSFEVGVIDGTVWTSEMREQSQGAEQNEEKHTAEVDMNMSTSFGPDSLEEVVEAENQQETAETIVEEGENEGAACSPSSSIQRRVLNTPTFSLISSSSMSQGQQEGDGTPAFVFTTNSGPNTPTFLGFDCNFEVGQSQYEESPFTFSSSYFNKKSPGTKLPGFLFDESDSRAEEEFPFSFSANSPQPKGAGETEDVFPFSFNFGKF